MSYVTTLNEPTTTFGYHQGGETLYHSLQPQIPEAVKSYWLLSNSMSLYSSTALTWASSYLSDRGTALQLIHSTESLNDNWDGFGGASILKEISSLAAGFVSSLPTHVPA